MPMLPLPLQWVGPVPPPVRRVEVPAAAPRAAEPSQPVRSGRAKRPRAVDDGAAPDDGRSVQRNLAVGKWRVIVAAAAHCCDKELVDESLGEDERRRSLDDALRERAPATLNKRAGSILLYLRWGRAKGYTDAELLPFRERTAYEYARDLADDEAPATRASSFVEAALLSSELLRMASENLLASARLKGAVYGSFEKKRLTKKRDGLTANAIWALEAIVVDEEVSCADRIFAGFTLWCAHTRQRVGDAVRVCEEPVLDPPHGPPEEADFIETSGGITKGGNLKRRRRLRLPLVCAARGLSDVPWAATWLRLRAEAGMRAEVDRTMMPALKAGDAWAQRSVTTDEFGDWLRLLTREGVPSEEGLTDYGVRSCKVTILSWAAKAGMPKPCRRILGGHAKAKDKTVAEYSRDELAEPLRMVGLMMRWIRDGEFEPEANRSGRWARGRQGPTWYPEASAAAKEPEIEDDGFEKVTEDQNEDGAATEDSGDETSDSDESSDGPASEVSEATVIPDGSSDEDEDVEDVVEAGEREEEEIVAVAAEALRVQADGERIAKSAELQRPLPIGGLYQHDPDDKGRARFTLHCGCPDDDEKLRCHRTIQKNGGVVYRQLFSWPLFNGGECGQCMPAEKRDVTLRAAADEETI